MPPELTANWVLTYQLLPRILAAPPQGMDPRLKATLSEANHVLGGMWRVAQGMGTPAPGAPLAGRLDVAGRPGIVIALPEPTQSPDAWFAASVEVDGTWRYFTLEKPGNDGDGPVLGECTADARHINHGSRPAPADLNAFLAHVSAVIERPITRGEGPYAKLTGVTYTGWSEGRWLVILIVVAAIIVALTYLR